MDLTGTRASIGQLLAHRSRRELLLAGATGALVGLGVAAFEWVTRDGLLDRVREAPLAVQVVAPLLGLVLAALALRHLAGGATPATSDEYIRAYHRPGEWLPLRPVLGRIVAGVATLGAGGSLGFEGPSLYLGAATGTAVQRRAARWLTRGDTRVLMVAGAAAGVAAIFKAPATGAVFALEVPYQDDTAHRMLLPALTASAVSYLVFVGLLGPTPLFAVDGTPPFDLRDLGGALVLGLVCGAGARLFALLITGAKRLSAGAHPLVRVPVAGLVLAALFVISYHLFGEGLSLGAGYSTLEYLTGTNPGVGLLVALLAIRVAANAATLAGGGVGGLFIPLVIAGALIGKIAATLVGDPSGTLFPLIGVAAFLGAGYRTPLAGVVFVAESTGRPGFVVPGLIASVAAQMVMGTASVSPYQQRGRVGHVERRLALPIRTSIAADEPTATPDTTLAELSTTHVLALRRTLVPVLDGRRFVGMVGLAALHQVPPEHWTTTEVAAVAERDWPTVEPDWPIHRAIEVMEERGVDTVAVTTGDDEFVGVVHLADLVALGEVLDQLDDGRPA